MIMFAIAIQAINITFLQLPQFYSLERDSDQKDINQIKIAFESLAKELSVMNYDNAIWDETYNFIEQRDPSFHQNNFDEDVYKNFGLNGIHIYDSQKEKIWGKVQDKYDEETKYFEPFDLPTPFVKAHILNSEQIQVGNQVKPVTLAGYTYLNNRLVLFSATSVFRSNLRGPTNGTLFFWRFVNEEVSLELQKRSGLTFNIEIIESVNENLTSLRTENSYVVGSFRSDKGVISDYYPFATGIGGIKFTYKAQARQFDPDWLNSSTIIASVLFIFTLLIVSSLVHYIIIRPILNAENLVGSIVNDADYSVRFNSHRKDELGKLFNLIDLLLEDVDSKKQALISNNLRLQQISNTDGLTNIANRRALDIYMKNTLSKSVDGLEVSMLVCDVDFFKKYND